MNHDAEVHVDDPDFNMSEFFVDIQIILWI